MSVTMPSSGAWKRVRLTRRSTQAWFAILILASLQPKRPPSLLALHREIHWLGFGVAAFLLFLVAPNLSRVIRRAGAVFLLGISLEWVQHLSYHRAFEWPDVTDDACAILAALAVYYWFSIWSKAASGKSS